MDVGGAYSHAVLLKAMKMLIDNLMSIKTIKIGCIMSKDFRKSDYQDVDRNCHTRNISLTLRGVYDLDDETKADRIDETQFDTVSNNYCVIHFGKTEEL